MRRLFLLLAIALFNFGLLFSLSVISTSVFPEGHGMTETGRKPKKHLKPFSEFALKKFLRKIAKQQKGNGEGEGYGSGAGGGGVTETVSVTASSPSDSGSITNTQTAGVDEGGIVKTHGDHLVVLRRGRLFTLSTGNNSLKSVSSVNAFGPDIDPDNSWYDEMLISGDNIVVIGYSYSRGGTEIGLFKIDPEGRLKYRATYHLRSNDYYSSRNYSSRLVGDKLIFYSPLDLSVEEKDLYGSLPALRKWRKAAKEDDFRRILDARDIYYVEDYLDEDAELALHTVTTCDLSSAEMNCTAKSAMGPSGNVFYTSAKSVYVWASPWYYDEKKMKPSLLFKMPLDGTPPSALRVAGSPVDQFSFHEDETEGLNTLVRSESAGNGMWNAEVSEGDVALLRISDEMFGDGSEAARSSNYLRLAKPDGYAFQNRFVGDYLMYGTGSGWGEQRKTEGKLYVVNWRSGDSTTIKLPHNVDRIDALSKDGIVIGTDSSDLFFTSIRLASKPEVVDTYSVKAASQGETRSHGFFYKPGEKDGGILGLPIAHEGRRGDRQLADDSASVVFLSNSSLKLNPIGELRSRKVAASNDGCKASCVDWYGNARPIFFRGRIFALLGYELVEGALRPNGIQEIRRIDFSPKAG
jgi:hypothetical protein